MLEMTDPSAATTYAHRDGRTTMTYACLDQADCRPVVTGRVLQKGGAAGPGGGGGGGGGGGWEVTPDVDTAFGPVGMQLGGGGQ